MSDFLTDEETKEFIPQSFRHLPVVELMKNEIDFNSDFLIKSTTGSGKSLLLPLVEAQKFPERTIYIREPSRVTAHAIYKSYQNLFGEYVTIGVMTSEKKENTDAQIVIVSDGILSYIFKKSMKDIVIYNDEIHQMIGQTEIELALQKKEIDRRYKKYGDNAEPLSRLLTATIDESQFTEYIENLKVYQSIKRKHDINYEVVNRDINSMITIFANNLSKNGENGLVFVPTRKETETNAAKLKGTIATDFIHAGEDSHKISKVMKEYADKGKPVCLFATIAAATGITEDFDRVLIQDEKISSTVKKGVMKIERVPCDNNLIIQMAGRAGRLKEGKVVLNSVTREDFSTIKPSKLRLPLEHETPYAIAMLMATYQISDIEEVQLLSDIDLEELEFAIKDLTYKNIIEDTGKYIKLTKKGKYVARLPMDIPLAILFASTPDEIKPAMLGALCMGYDNLWGILQFDKSVVDDYGRHPKVDLHEDFRSNQSEFVSKALIMQEAFINRSSGTLKYFCEEKGFIEKSIRGAMYTFSSIEKHIAGMRSKLVNMDINEDVQNKMIDTIVNSNVFDNIVFTQFDANFGSYKTFENGFLTILSGDSLLQLNITPGQYEGISAIGKIIEVKTKNKKTLRILNCPTLINWW